MRHRLVPPHQPPRLPAVKSLDDRKPRLERLWAWEHPFPGGSLEVRLENLSRLGARNELVQALAAWSVDLRVDRGHHALLLIRLER
jgi:hypothetical protein